MPAKRGRYVVDEASATPLLGSTVPLSAMGFTATRHGAVTGVTAIAPAESQQPLVASGKIIIPDAVRQRMETLGTYTSRHHGVPDDTSTDVVHTPLRTESSVLAPEGGNERPAGSGRSTPTPGDRTMAPENDDEAMVLLQKRQAAAAAKGVPVRPLIRTRHRSRTASARATAATTTDSDHLAPFANSADDVITFGSAPTADASWRRHNSNLSSSSEGSWSDEGADEEEGGIRVDGSARGKAKQRECRHRRLVDEHMAGYDDMALAAEESALQASPSDRGSSDTGDEEVSSESEQESLVTGSSSTSRTMSITEKGAEESKPVANESDRGFGAYARVAKNRERATKAVHRTQVGHSDTPPPHRPAAADPLTHRHRFGQVYYETYLNSQAAYPCHHTLLCVRGPMTVQGPCGIVGLGVGEASLGGYLIGKKQVVLWSSEQRAVLMPMKKMKGVASLTASPTQHAPASHRSRGGATTSFPLPGAPVTGAAAHDPLEVLSVDPLHCKRQLRQLLQGGAFLSSALTSTATESVEGCDSGSESDDDLPEDDVELVFGTVDWEWVGRSLKAWRQLFANELPTLVLVVQPYHPGRLATRKHFLKNKSRGSKWARREEDAWLRMATEAERARHQDDMGAYMEVPLFFSRHSEPNIDAALLPEVVPDIARQSSGCVVVVGSQNIGKSTLCRYLANLLQSVHGTCYWLDLDLGQPEFGVPGQLALHRLCGPLRQPHDRRSAEQVGAYCLGRPTIGCPLSAARAIAALCDVVSLIAQRHPVVVNTHGWVLNTGRRATVEVIRRLAPEQVVHLVKAGEDPWARQTTALMDPQCGLNAQVVARRFLVRDFSSAGTVRGDSIAVPRFLGQLPYASSQQPPVAASAAAAGWRGAVRTVHVNRDAQAAAIRQHHLKSKGARGRQKLWEHYLRPLLIFYESGRDNSAEGAQTTLLRAPMHSLHRIVLCEGDERWVRRPLEEVAALLEHTVVGVQLAVPGGRHHPTVNHRKSCTQPPPPHPAAAAPSCEAPTVSLANLPQGFAITCYGYVESTESDLLGDGSCGGNGAPMIALRLPFAPSVTRRLLGIQRARAAESGPVRVSIAVSTAVQADTHFMENYP